MSISPKNLLECSQQSMSLALEALDNAAALRHAVGSDNPPPCFEFLVSNLLDLHSALRALAAELRPGAGDGAPVVEARAVVTAEPCDHRGAGAHLSRAEDGLGLALEVIGQGEVCDESWKLLQESVTKAWSGVRLAKVELGLRQGDE